MKLNKKPGFVLLETLLAIALFALAAATLSYSFANGILCQKRAIKRIDKFEDLIFKIASTCANISELKDIKNILLPTDEELNVVFEVESTATEALYKVTVKSDHFKYGFYIAHMGWNMD